jgi:hypothetical protein
MKKRTLLLLTLGMTILFQTITIGQETLYAPTNSWALLLNRAKFTKHWYMTNELHQRNQWFFKGEGQFLWRPSIDYKVNEQLEFSFGYSYIRTHPNAPYPLPIASTENNIWQQALLKYDIGKVHFQNRFRQENRWFDHIDNENGDWVKHGDDYANRFRYRITGTFDVYHLKESEKAIFINTFNEFWFNQDNKLRPVSFARNWLYLGVGFRLDKNTSFQTGYMNQWDQVKGNYIKMDIVQFTVQKNFDFSKPKI